MPYRFRTGFSKANYEKAVIMNKQQRTKILELRKNGKNYEQIEEALGINKKAVSGVCLRNGLGLSKEEIEESRARANAKRSESNRQATIEWYKKRGITAGDWINRLPDGLFYVDGSCDDSSDIEIACEKCGNSFFRKGQTVRKGILKTCPICDLFEREEQEYLVEMDKLFKANRKEEEREQRELERLNSIETRTCEICGEKFVTTKKSRAVCCSSECSKKRANRLASKKHDKRIVPSKRIDKGIDARSLFRRDKGVCWICGGQCNLEDYTMRGEVFIAGDWYPSVDHIIPICEGGEDSWENVKLAHRKCNSQRYYQEKDSPLVKNF